jgi:hypothetical protein
MLRDLVPKIRSPTDLWSAAALGSPPTARQPLRKQNHSLRDMFDSARMYVFACVRVSFHLHHTLSFSLAPTLVSIHLMHTSETGL